MNLQKIDSLVQSMDIKTLTDETFEIFATHARALFIPHGARFHNIYRLGDCLGSRTYHDFSKGRPVWKQDMSLVFDRLEQREVSRQKKLCVYFDIEDNIWGVNHNRLPLKFGFDPGRALYIARQEGSGTPENPYEDVYIKI